MARFTFFSTLFFLSRNEDSKTNLGMRVKVGIAPKPVTVSLTGSLASEEDELAALSAPKPRGTLMSDIEPGEVRVTAFELPLPPVAADIARGGDSDRCVDSRAVWSAVDAPRARGGTNC